MKYTVLITGVGGMTVGESIVQALKFSSARYKIIGTNIEPFSAGLFQTDRSYILPPASDPNYIENLMAICNRDGVRVIIPGSEVELEKIAENIDKFTELGVLPLVNPINVIMTCLDKWNLYQWLIGEGISCPRTALSDQDMMRLVSEIGFRVIVKSRKGSGSKHIFFIQDADELNFFVSYHRKYGIEPMIQEYVGNSSQEYTIGILISKSGEIIDSIALHRKLTGASLKATLKQDAFRYALSTGISQGIIEDAKELQDWAEGIAKRLGARGPLNIQCRLTEDGPFVLEINPRFSGTASIRAAVGFNEPDILIRNFLENEEFGRIDYRKGIIALRGLANIVQSSQDFYSFLGYAPNATQDTIQ